MLNKPGDAGLLLRHEMNFLKLKTQPAYDQTDTQKHS